MLQDVIVAGSTLRPVVDACWIMENLTDCVDALMGDVGVLWLLCDAIAEVTSAYDHEVHTHEVSPTSSTMVRLRMWAGSCRMCNILGPWSVS